MAKTDYKTIDEYHKAFPKNIQERMQAIRELVHTIVPQAEEVISYQIPAFKGGTNFLIYYSSHANHSTLSSPWSAALLKAFEVDLKNFKVTKSAIQLPHDKPLPLGFVKRLLAFRKKEIAISK